MNELKPCPFCDHDVKLVVFKGLRRTTVMITHRKRFSITEECCEHRRWNFYNDYFAQFENKYAADAIPRFINRWNERVELEKKRLGKVTL